MLTSLRSLRALWRPKKHLRILPPEQGQGLSPVRATSHGHSRRIVKALCAIFLPSQKGCYTWLEVLSSEKLTEKGRSLKKRSKLKI